MILNHSIDYLCRALRRERPDWGSIQKRFEDLPIFKTKISQKNKSYELHQYAKDFSELHLDISLEHIAQNSPIKNIQFLPRYTQKSPLQNQDYKMYNNDSGRIIIETDQGVHWEYDQIIMVNNVPTVLEIKIRQWNTGKNRKRKQEDGTYTLEKDSCVKNNLRSEIYNKKLEPVQKLFGRDIGYIMVISKDQYPFVFNHSETIVNQFIQDNGRLVPFYTDRLTFRDHVREKVKEFGYLLKEEPMPPSPQPKLYLP